MSENGGRANAYTSMTDTNFHFEVSNEGFEEGLDRMAQFFIFPAFTQSAAAKEIEAVDSEFQLELQDSIWIF